MTPVMKRATVERPLAAVALARVRVLDHGPRRAGARMHRAGASVVGRPGRRGDGAGSQQAGCLERTKETNRPDCEHDAPSLLPPPGAVDPVLHRLSLDPPLDL